MKRLAKRFEIFTGRGGTMVLLEVGEGRLGESCGICGDGRCHIPANVCAAMAGTASTTADANVGVLADGLGHGLGAAEAAQEAIATLRKRSSLAPGEILGYVHDALKKTRGAVAAVAEIRLGDNALIYRGRREYFRRSAERRRLSQPGLTQWDAGYDGSSGSRNFGPSGLRTRSS